MTDDERRAFQGWARVFTAGWFILWAVAAITVYRVNPRRAAIAVNLALIGLPGIILAMTIGRGRN
jgi:CHASE2 domain-containing sensor protein